METMRCYSCCNMQGYIGEGLDLFSGVVGELVYIGLPLNKTPVTFRVHKLSKYR